jgi:hypothetical protein
MASLLHFRAEKDREMSDKIVDLDAGGRLRSASVG